VALVVALVAAILVAVLVTVLVTILATIVVAVAAVTVTFAVPYSRTLTDAAIVAERTDVVWAMPQTASFYATLGLPVNLRGVHFARLAATAERHESSSSKARSAMAQRRAPRYRLCALRSAMRRIRKFTPGPPRRRADAYPQATN
jgi:hypothetical protein